MSNVHNPNHPSYDSEDQHNYGNEALEKERKLFEADAVASEFCLERSDISFPRRPETEYISLSTGDRWAGWLAAKAAAAAEIKHAPVKPSICDEHF